MPGRKLFTLILLMALLTGCASTPPSSPSTTAASQTLSKDDIATIEALDCADLKSVRAEFVSAEDDLKSAIKTGQNSTIATNVVGAALLASVGVGFFSWNDDTDVKQALSEVTEFRIALDNSARNKKCPLDTPQAH